MEMTEQITIEELRFITRQLSQSSNFRFASFFEEQWITDALIEKALITIAPVFRERLYKVVGAKREDWKNMVFPKINGGNTKPCMSSACYAVISSMRSLRLELRTLNEKEKIHEETHNDKEQPLTCPHCRGVISILFTIK